MKKFALATFLLAASIASAQTMVAAYVSPSTNVWNPWNAAASYGAISTVPSLQAQLYCQASAGAQWAPCVMGSSSFTAGGDLGGTSTSQTVLGLTHVTNAAIPVAISAPSASFSGTVAAGTALLTNTEYSLGTCTTAATIDPANGTRQTVMLTNAQTCALSFTQPASGTASITLKIIQSASGSFNGAISGGKWPGGTVPTITATSGAVDFISCYLDRTNAYCVATQNFQ